MIEILNRLSVYGGLFFGVVLTFGFVSSTENFTQSLALTGFVATVTLGVAIFTIADIFEKNLKEYFDKDIRIFYNEIKKKEPWERWTFLKRKREILMEDGTTLVGELSNLVFKYKSENGNILIELPTTLLDCFEVPVFEDYKKMVKNEKYFVNFYFSKSKSKKKLDMIFEYWCVIDILKMGKDMVIVRMLKEAAITSLMGSAIVTVIFLFGLPK